MKYEETQVAGNKCLHTGGTKNSSARYEQQDNSTGRDEIQTHFDSYGFDVLISSTFLTNAEVV